MISTFGAVFLHEWHSLKIRGNFFSRGPRAPDPPPLLKKSSPLWLKKKWTPSHGLKELAHLWCMCKIYLYFAPVCRVRLPNDSQKDNCDGIPQDPVRVREELHLQNVPLPIHQQLFELDLHSILQGPILHRPRRRKCQIQLHFKVDFIPKGFKVRTKQ